MSACVYVYAGIYTYMCVYTCLSLTLHIVSSATFSDSTGLNLYDLVRVSYPLGSLLDPPGRISVSSPGAPQGLFMSALKHFHSLCQLQLESVTDKCHEGRDFVSLI